MGGPGQAPLRAAFERHYVNLVRVCTLLSGRRDDGEEIAQEAFVRASKRIEGLDPEAVGPYLRRTAVNLWKNRLRRLAVERRARAAERAPSAHPDVENRDEMWTAVQALPRRQRACVVLRYYEDLSERETAEALGCSVGTVKSQTSRALEKQRKELGDGSCGAPPLDPAASCGCPENAR